MYCDNECKCNNCKCNNCKCNNCKCNKINKNIIIYYSDTIVLKNSGLLVSQGIK